MVKINILSPGRFHVLDLARELAAQGFDVKFYSYVPTKRAQRYGLKKENSQSLLGIMLPLLGLQKIFSKNIYLKRVTVLFQDFISGIYMRKADVVIAMSGNYVYSLKKAKKFNAKIIIERGSKHILEQKRILDKITMQTRHSLVPDFNVKRELTSYDFADFISIPSIHVARSFEKYKYQKNKLFINPYGVDLKSFHPIKEEKIYDVIAVGNWSEQKGSDLLASAIMKTSYRLLHVGPLNSLPFPKHPNFTHYDAVDQIQLVNFYSKAKIFCLPSRQEGLAMVQLQAVACNLPVVCSEHSGGEDIKKILDQTESIFVINDPLSVSAVEKTIEKAIEFWRENLNNEHYNMEKLNLLTWSAYGERYAQFLNTKILG